MLAAHGEIHPLAAAVRQPAGGKVDLAVVFGQQAQPFVFDFQNDGAHDFLAVNIFNYIRWFHNPKS